MSSHHPARPSTAFGEQMYALGRDLVASGAARPETLVFDCDEVLWDWLMDMGHILRTLPRTLRRRDLMGHREYVVAKPGLFEMLFGMRHEALERGLDPDIRLWTHGYPWRLWRIAQELPGFAELVGLAPDASPEAWDAHATIFTRVDYTRAVLSLTPERLARLPDAPRSVLEAHLDAHPTDSNLKLPELAPLIGKEGFRAAELLVDDHGRNIKRFIASGRRGVRVHSRAPRVLRGRVPNTVWRRGGAAVQSLSNTIAAPIAEAIRGLASEAPPASRSVRAAAPLAPSDRSPVAHIEVPGARIREQWIEPMKRLERALQSGHVPWR